MAEQTLKDVGIWIAGRSYAGVSNSVSLETSADTPESTNFAGEFRTRAEGGLKTSALSLEGFFHTDGPDAEQFASLGDERSVMIVPAGQVAGDLAFVVPVAVSAHSPLTGSIGELAAFSYAAEGDGQPFRAQVLDIRENLQSNTVTTRQQLGAIPAGQILHVWVHVTRLSGTLQAQLRSAASATGASTARASANAITSTGLHLLEVPGPRRTSGGSSTTRYRGQPGLRRCGRLVVQGPAADRNAGRPRHPADAGDPCAARRCQRRRHPDGE